MSEDKMREIFGKNLKSFLSLNGYSQADLARHLSVSNASAADWCNGKIIPRMDKVQKICRWLNCEITDLLEEHAAPTERYYIDKDAQEMAEFLYKNPDYKVLFDASRKVKPEDIDFVKQMIDRMGGND
jgi:transcriptional regulator with XRE-family HTH domain